MRIFNVAGYTLSTSIALTSLAGCAGSSEMTPTSLAQPGVGSSPIQGAAFQKGGLDGFLAMRGRIVPGHGRTRPSFMDPRAVGKPLLFVSNNAGNVDIFLQSGKKKMVGQITGLTSADYLATDSAGDLYVADPFSGNSGNLIIFAPPYTNGPELTFAAGRYPVAVAVSRQGTVAATTCTILSGSQCGPGVLFYAAGSTTPCATVLVDQSTFSYIGFAVFDHKGNLYVDGINSSNVAVAARIDGGCNARKAQDLTISNTIANPSSIKIDKAGRIAILDTTNQNAAVIDTYDPPKGGSLGSPVSTTQLTVPTYAGQFTFRASGGDVWVTYEVSPSEASKYAYPSGGAPERTVTGTPSSVADGVAVTPPLVP